MAKPSQPTTAKPSKPPVYRQGFHGFAVSRVGEQKKLTLHEPQRTDMARQTLVVGTRVRATVSTSSGWKGMGTVVESCSRTVTLVKDGHPLNGYDGQVL